MILSVGVPVERYHMPRESCVGLLEDEYSTCWVKLCDHVPQYAVPLPREEVSLPGLIIGTGQSWWTAQTL